MATVDTKDTVPLMLDQEDSVDEERDAMDKMVSTPKTSVNASEMGFNDDLESNLAKDFSYRNNVAGAARHIRMGFLRKVYGLLLTQLLLTTLVCSALLVNKEVRSMIKQQPWMLMVAFLLSMGLLIALQLKRHETPTNLVLLAAFTVCESYTVGVVVSMYDALVVAEALFLTAGVVGGLTAFTLQTKRDFTHWGMALYCGLWVLVGGGFVHILVGGESLDLALAIGGALLFSGFIVYDTQMILHRLSPEEYIMATIQLYLDIINLFIELLRILDKVNRS